MNQTEVLEALGSSNAIITGSHIVYTSGKHGSSYVNKDAVYPHTLITSRLCLEIARRFAKHEPEVVVAPAVGGVILSQWTAYHLTVITEREVLGVYAERNESVLLKNGTDSAFTLGIICSDSDAKKQLRPNAQTDVGNVASRVLPAGESLVFRGNGFGFKRGYDKLIAGKRVLVVEDVLTTGGSVRAVVDAIRALKGDIVGVGVLCNRGGITVQDIGDVPRLEALVHVTLDAWDEAECPLCRQGVPINTSVGKGSEFLVRKK